MSSGSFFYKKLILFNYIEKILLFFIIFYKLNVDKLF